METKVTNQTDLEAIDAAYQAAVAPYGWEKPSDDFHYKLTLAWPALRDELRAARKRIEELERSDEEALSKRGIGWIVDNEARLKREGAAEAWEEMRRQAVEVGLESGLKAKLIGIIAAECAEQAERLRTE